MKNRRIIILVTLMCVTFSYSENKSCKKQLNLNFYSYSKTVKPPDFFFIDTLLLSKSFELLLKNEVIKKIPAEIWSYYSISILKKDKIIWFSVTNSEYPVNIVDLLDSKSKIKKDYFLYGMFQLKSKRFYVVSEKKSEPLTNSDLQHFFLQRKEFYRVTLEYSSNVVDVLQDNVSYWYFLIEDNKFKLVKCINTK